MEVSRSFINIKRKLWGFYGNAFCAVYVRFFLFRWPRGRNQLTVMVVLPTVLTHMYKTLNTILLSLSVSKVVTSRSRIGCQFWHVSLRITVARLSEIAALLRVCCYFIKFYYRRTYVAVIPEIFSIQIRR